MAIVREKFATQIDAKLLKAVRDLAETEGRKIQTIVEDALRRHLTDPDISRRVMARAHVRRAYDESVERYAGLYDRLAK